MIESGYLEGRGLQKFQRQVVRRLLWTFLPVSHHNDKRGWNVPADNRSVAVNTLFSVEITLSSVYPLILYPCELDSLLQLPQILISQPRDQSLMSNPLS
jgi:hypothetical protein